MSTKVKFGSKIGLIAATVGSAVGLGNVWRFPAEAQANGGAAFLLIYVLCVLLLGIPVMLGEFALGREGETDAVGDYRRLSPGKPWWLIGATGLVASYMILCFYIVVAGWTLEYLVNSITGDLFNSVEGTHDSAASLAAHMQSYVVDSTGPLVYTWILVGLNVAVLLCGVRKGIERMSNMLMPLLFVLLLIFVVVVLSLPNAGEGINFFLNPDFSKVNPGVVINALGQAFFSLSLGMGILITYAAYFPKDTKLVRTSVTVSMLDMLVAVMMGLIIFPAVTAFGMQDCDLEGATLVFVTLPEVFRNMGSPQLWSTLFFTLLLVAALTSTISISEVSIKFFQDRFKMRRWVAVATVMAPLLVFGSICAISVGGTIQLFGMDIFDLLDTVATNILLPVGSLAMCIYAGWFAPKHLMLNQLTNERSLKATTAHVAIFIIRFVAPVLILIILASQFINI